MVGVDSAVGEDNNLETVFNGIFGIAANAFQAPLQRFPVAIGPEIGVYRFGLKMMPIHKPELVELLCGQHGLIEFYLLAMFGRFGEEVIGGPHK